MHHSRLAGFIIDCQTADVDGAARFWSNALGMPLRGESDGAYRQLHNALGGSTVAVQYVAHPSRVHLDIEALDREAVVSRQEKLRARRPAAVNTSILQGATTGPRFC